MGNKEFEYGGYHFEPIRQLTEFEADFNEIVRHQKLDLDLGFCRKGYAYESKYNYSHSDFYAAADSPECDLFRCTENGKVYIPCANDLQEYTGVIEKESIQSKSNKIRVLIVEPGEYPREAEIEDTLEAEQDVVGGLIECVYPWTDAILVCDDEGLINGKPFNRAINKQMRIHGTFFICGEKGENFASLTDEQIHKYKELLLAPQVAIRTEQGILVRSCSPKVYRMLMGKPPAPQKDGPHER